MIRVQFNGCYYKSAVFLMGCGADFLLRNATPSRFASTSWCPVSSNEPICWKSKSASLYRHPPLSSTEGVSPFPFLKPVPFYIIKTPFKWCDLSWFLALMQPIVRQKMRQVHRLCILATNWSIVLRKKLRNAQDSLHLSTDGAYRERSILKVIKQISSLSTTLYEISFE